MRGWAKTTGVAAAGGALTACVTGLMEHERLGIYFGSGRLIAMVITGAVTAVIPWLLRRPGARRTAPPASGEDDAARRKELEARPPSGPGGV